MILTLNILQTDFDINTPLVVDTSGIVVNGIPLNPGPQSSAGLEIDNGLEAVIEITQTGFYPYNITVSDVYKADKSIDVVMVPQVTDINGPNYLRPWPTVIVFNDPCNFCVDYYIGSSYGGSVSWYVNNIEYAQGNSGKACFCNPGEYQIKVRNTTSQSVVEVPGCPPVVTQLWDNQFANTITGNTVKSDISALSLYLDQDLESNLPISEYRVDISYEIETTYEPAVGQDTCFYSRGEEVTIVPTIGLNREGADPAEHTIEYTVTDPEGLTLDLPQSLFPLDILEPNITFTLDKMGTYTVLIEVNDHECGNVFQEEFIVETCNFVFLKYLECNSYEIQNRSSATPFNYKIADIANTTIESQTGSLEPGQAVSVSFEEVSMFVLEASYTRNELPVTETYLLNNYCGIEECFTSYIEDLLCEPDPRCSPCPPESDLKQMFLFYNAYFMKVNKLFQTNSFFTALDEEDLTYVVDIKLVMDKIVEFCKRRNCTDSVTSSFQSSYQTEGPYDFVGRGKSLDKGCKTCK